MLQRLPVSVGRALQNARAGIDKLVYQHHAFAHVIETIQLKSPAFVDGHALPRVYTADGEGISPPLLWSGVPEAARTLVLIAEDADSPTHKPLVHAIAWFSASITLLTPGALMDRSDYLSLGRNSMLQRAYLPPDPPPGHGVHRYAFQLFALDMQLPQQLSLGRGKLMEHLRGNVIARGWTTATYARSER